MKKQQSGFTLIELVMVIVILGILAASFAPKFVNLGDDAAAAAKKGAEGAVKAALTVAIAETKGNPTVATLATYVQGTTVSAAAGSVGIDVGDLDSAAPGGDAAAEVVATYSNVGCSTATSAATPGVTDIVRCVGAVIP